MGLIQEWVYFCQHDFGNDGIRKLQVFLFMTQQPPVCRTSSLSRLHDHIQTHTTVGRTTLGGWSAGRTDLYLTAHNIHKRQPPMPLAGFEPAIPASELMQTDTIDRASTGTGTSSFDYYYYYYYYYYYHHHN